MKIKLLLLFTWFSFLCFANNYANMTLEDLMNIEVISATKELKKMKDIPASVHVITQAQIQQYGYTNITEIINSVPGLYVLNTHMISGKSFGMRGYWTSNANRNMLILLNGVNYRFDINSSFPSSLVNLPVESINKVEVIRGPMSNLYGSGALYGVINIITESVVNKNNATVLLGSNKEKKVTASFNTTTAKIKTGINILFENEPDQTMKLNDLTSDPLPYKKTTLEKENIFVQSMSSFHNFAFETKFMDSKSGLFFTLPPNKDGSTTQIKTWNSSLRYNKQLSEYLKYNVEIVYNYNHLKTNYGFFQEPTEDFWSVENWYTNSVEFESNIFYELNKKTDFMLGFSELNIYRIDDFYDLPALGNHTLENNHQYLEDNSTMKTQSLFAQACHKFNQNFSLISALRAEKQYPYEIGSHQVYSINQPDSTGNIHTTDTVINITKDEYNRNKIDLIPEIAFLYQTTFFVSKLMYGEAINRPSWFQIMKNSLDPNASTNLQPETIKSIEFYNSFLWNTTNFSASIFYNTHKNLITRIIKLDNDGNYKSWHENAGKLKTIGYEVQIVDQSIPKTNLEFAFTFQKTKEHTPLREDLNPAYSPQSLAYVKASFRPIEKFVCGITANYVSEMDPYTEISYNENSNNFEYNMIGKTVDSYINVGGHITIVNLIEGLKLKLLARNLFNDEIRYPTTTHSSWADKGYKDHGIRFMFSTSYEW